MEEELISLIGVPSNYNMWIFFLAEWRSGLWLVGTCFSDKELNLDHRSESTKS